MNRTPMIPALIESARDGLLWLIFSAAFCLLMVAITVWDCARACWDTLVLGKSEAEQLRDYLDTD